MTDCKQLSSILNSYEKLALLKQPNPKAPTGLRNLCIITLMLKLGLRVSEVINLKDVDLDWENGKIHIEGSGGAKERTLWIERAELELLEKWRHTKPAKSTHLFTTLDGKVLQDRYLREMIKRIARKAGIGKDVHPHLLRYTFAVELMREIRDTFLLQEALGHRSISTTRAYVTFLLNENEESYLKNHSTRRSGTPVSKGEQERLMVETKKTIHKTEVKEESNGYDNQPDDVSSNINISFISGEKDLDDNIAIPALKCSQCDYILHYQGNCPKCGTSFTAILRHWGRNV